MYEVKIRETNVELTNRERIRIKDLQNAHKLDELVTPESSFSFEFGGYAILDIHNDNSKDNTDYTTYLVFDRDGNKYYTGSKTFWNSMWAILSEMDDDDFSVEVTKHESKNYKGKFFLTASIL